MCCRIRCTTQSKCTHRRTTHTCLLKFIAQQRQRQRHRRHSHANLNVDIGKTPKCERYAIIHPLMCCLLQSIRSPFACLTQRGNNKWGEYDKKKKKKI